MGVHAPTFVSPGITGYGSALSVNRSTTQYVSISNYFSLTYTSFTIEMWIYATALAIGEYGLFSQSQQLSINLNLHCVIRSYRMYMGFYANDVNSTTNIAINTWYHVAFVYNYPLRQQILYLNGVKVGLHSSAGPLVITSGPIAIGAADSSGAYDSFNGYIDQVYLITRAKDASELLDDATLVTWHSFNGSYIDSGPNGINGTGVN
ncbi:unnamed protein product, partial [Rotaria sp. Silwood2]